MRAFIGCVLLTTAGVLFSQNTIPLDRFFSFRPDSARERQIPALGLADAYQLYKRPNVVFVDTRPLADFRRGSIKGAIHHESSKLHAAVGSAPNVVVFGAGEKNNNPLLAEMLGGRTAGVYRLDRTFGEWVKLDLPHETNNQE